MKKICIYSDCVSFLQICNAVAVAALLNATLVLPRFLYSNVWKDPRYYNLLKTLEFIRKSMFCWCLRKCVNCSQFGDIYQEERFIEYLKDEVHIVKDLPQHLKPIDDKNLSLVCSFCILSFFFYLLYLLLFWNTKIIFHCRLLKCFFFLIFFIIMLFFS